MSKISYCVQCRPPRVLAAGPAVAVQHRLADGVHTQIRTIPLPDADAQRPGESPQGCLDRLQGKYQNQLK